MDVPEDTPSVEGLPTSLEEAKALGVKLFFSGKPCRHGHLAPRRARNTRVCVVCERAHAKKRADTIKGSCSAHMARRADERKFYAERRSAYPDAHLPATRAEALAVGAEHYFTGQPCKRGHIDRRSTAWLICRSCDHLRTAAYRIGKKDIFRKHSANWYQNNKEKAKAANAAWRSANRELTRLYGRKYSLLKRCADGEFTLADIKAILKSQRNRCAYCRRPTKNGYHVDHIQPVSKGGSNHPRNLQILCQPCNHKKNAKDPIEFAQQIGLLI